MPKIDIPLLPILEEARGFGHSFICKAVDPEIFSGIPPQELAPPPPRKNPNVSTSAKFSDAHRIALLCSHSTLDYSQQSVHFAWRQACVHGITCFVLGNLVSKNFIFSWPVPKRTQLLTSAVSGVQPWSGVACTVHLLTQLHHLLRVERRSMGLGSFFPSKKAFAHVIPFGPFCFLGQWWTGKSLIALSVF